MTSNNTTRQLVKKQPLTTDVITVFLMAHGLNGREGVPFCSWGPPGTGKSTKIRAVAQDLGMHVETVILSNREPSEVCGTPIPNRVKTESGDEEIIVRYAMPLWARNVRDKAAAGIPSLVFFDELTTCARETQAASLRIINEGSGGDWMLDSSVRFAAAANPPSCAANGHDLAPPMANRMGHVGDPATSPQEWAAWLQNNGGSKFHLNYKLNDKESRAANTRYSELSALMAANWDVEFSRATALVGTFIERHPTCLSDEVDGNNEKYSQAWASRRTWECAARVLATARCLGMSDKVQQDVMVALVGEAHILELLQFNNSLDLPDLMDILNGNKANFEVDPAKTNVAAVVLTGLTSTAIALKERNLLTKGQLHNYWKFFNLPSTRKVKDIMARQLQRVIRPDSTLAAPSSQDYTDVLAALNKITTTINNSKRKS